MSSKSKNLWRPPPMLVWIWLYLLAFLALTVTMAYVPIGAFNTVIALAIAAIKAILVAAIFMELRDSRALVLVFAGTGFYWLAIMLWLALGDYLTRPNFPPRLHLF